MSETLTDNGVAKAVFAATAWLFPPVFTIEVGNPAELVSVNWAEETFAAEAVTMYDPETVFAESVGEATIPTALLITTVEPPNTANAPEPGSENVTDVPETGLP